MNYIKYIYTILFVLLVSMTNVDGQELRLFKTFDALEKHIIRENDTTYVINFWATWCKPCVQELPYFEQLYQETKDKKVKIILVSLDFSKQIESHLKPFITKNNYSSEIVLMADKQYNDWLHKVDENWSGSIPATLLVKGKNRLFMEQEFESQEELSDWVYSFIKS